MNHLYYWVWALRDHILGAQRASKLDAVAKRAA